MATSIAPAFNAQVSPESNWSSVLCQVTNSFIHSLIVRISMAPLKADYSAALPIPARLKRTVSGEHKE